MSIRASVQTRRFAHSAGVNDSTSVILAAGRRVKTSFRYSKGLILCKRQLAIRLQKTAA